LGNGRGNSGEGEGETSSDLYGAGERAASYLYWKSCVLCVPEELRPICTGRAAFYVYRKRGVRGRHRRGPSRARAAPLQGRRRRAPAARRRAAQHGFGRRPLRAQRASGAARGTLAAGGGTAASPPPPFLLFPLRVPLPYPRARSRAGAPRRRSGPPISGAWVRGERGHGERCASDVPGAGERCASE